MDTDNGVMEARGEGTEAGWRWAKGEKTGGDKKEENQENFLPDNST